MELKTGLTAQKLIFNRLLEVELKQLVSLTGDLYQLQRPKGSVLEDIVVSTLTMGNDQVQEGTLSVNIYLPNLNNNSALPEISRFEVITNAVVESLVNYSGYDYAFDVSTSGIPVREGDEWSVNVQVEFWTLRVNQN